ncbi:nitroreductase family protein [Methanogenium marinum]|uniref:Nitroreductase family protein n=1 Tax=Methanogenium marinum TaxID=348610 RepID=A0A9Q4KPG7_9EURY|nr:nitroreductase family protein [Methanogenium marinum]MDE4908163.1 nitroreductase family protein [Methanogenium marinum]
MATILVDEDLCTRCGICSVVCPMSIIDPAVDENTLPVVRDVNADMCIACGNCEVTCPTQALTLNLRPDEKEDIPADAGRISAEDIGSYLKKRRSVRNFTKIPVAKEEILQMLDIARYAPSGSNGQPVEWIVVHDPEDVKTVSALTIEWMKTLIAIAHPLNVYAPVLIRAWKNGHDVICRDAPHMLVAHIPENTPIASVDAIIALSHFDIAAPAFGIGTCWAGFVSMAALSYEPLRDELGIPPGRTCAFAILFGHPKYKTYGLPRRNPVQVTWR